ncbi:MAG: glycosyltransferase [Psychroserpens sp.]|nr:glycosyltransferase [Psychroserpens sp.]
MKDSALIIFTRNPELGKCKTRLAKTIGDQAALDIYKFLLSHTSKVATNVDADRFVFYTECIESEDSWSSEYFQKELQQGVDLGERMLNAFQYILEKGYKKVVIIGSDLLEITSEIIEEAYYKLDSNDIVIGPALDGGYYLLGMKELISEIFSNKEWGTSSVYEHTINNLQKHKVSVLKELNDIDTFDDLKQYEQLKPFYETHDKTTH